MISHVFLTSTSSIALRLTFLRIDLEPKVATSLGEYQSMRKSRRYCSHAYQTVATPPSREVRTRRKVRQLSVRSYLKGLVRQHVHTFVAIKHVTAGLVEPLGNLFGNTQGHSMVQD